MKKTVLFFVAFSFLITACTYEKGEVAEPISITDCVNDSTIDIIDVAVEDDFFNPATITIIQGDTVKWTYAAGASVHTSTCDGTGGTSLPVGAISWDSGVLVPGDSYKTAISVVGNYTYICTIHGISMSGTIVVKPRCQ